MWIWKSNNVNWDKGSYKLSHVWSELLTDVSNRKSVMMKTSDWRSKLETSTMMQEF